MKVIFIFIDGIGVGEDNPTFNPCCHSPCNILHPKKKSPFDGIKLGIGASLGVPGCPQSATGQTSIYTGKNAAQLVGKHLFGFPNDNLIELISQHSIFKEILATGYSCKFINAFRPVFFTTPELFENARLSVTSEMNRKSYLPFASINDIRKDKALYHDYTNSELISKGFQLQEFNAQKAAEVIVHLSEQKDLVLYEYFLTDMAGHSRNMDFAISEIEKIDLLIYYVVQKAIKCDTAVVVCSDHGNIEDMRTKTHTTNPAFFSVWANASINEISDLTEVKQLTLDLINK